MSVGRHSGSERGHGDGGFGGGSAGVARRVWGLRSGAPRLLVRGVDFAPDTQEPDADET